MWEVVSERVRADLRGAYSEVEVEEWGSVVGMFRDSRFTACKFSRASHGEPVVLVQALVLLDVHAPPGDLYELVCLLQSRLGFGSLAVIGLHFVGRRKSTRCSTPIGSPAAATTKRFVRLVHEEARAQAHALRMGS